MALHGLFTPRVLHLLVVSKSAAHWEALADGLAEGLALDSDALL